MQKLLFIVLMVFLPLQATWVMASGYCEHSRGSHDQHFGHHEGHHHEADDGGDEADKVASDAPSTSNDSDAAHCHGVGVAVLSTDALMPALIGTLPLSFSVRVDWRPPPIAPPERPQWASHA